MDPVVTPSVESGGAGAGENVGQHSASERSAEEHDLQEGLAGLARLATNQLGLEDLLTRVATYAVKAIPGADGAGGYSVRHWRVVHYGRRHD